MPNPHQADVPPVVRLRQSADEAWRRREFPAYFRLMAEAVRFAPTDAQLLLQLGFAHGLRGSYADAERSFEAAVATAPDRVEALVAAGLHSRGCMRYDWAERYLTRAAAEPAATADTLAKLAEVRERLRRTEAADDAVDRALSLDPRSQLAGLVRGRLFRAAGRLLDGERVTRDVLARTDADGWSTRVRAGYELAANLDRQGRYDDAMAALAAAKSELVPRATGYLAEERATQRMLGEIAAGLTADRFRRWAAADPQPHPRRRVAVIGGHPRSGTTLLEQVLDAHPSIVSAEETPFFHDAYLDLGRARAGERDLPSLLDHLPASAVRQARATYFRRTDQLLAATATAPAPDQLLVDKNPSLTALIPALVRVIPDVQLIVALRDPRDVCLSCYMQPLPLNPVSAAYLTVGGTVEDYCGLMRFWLAVRPLLPTPALEVRYEDVVDDVRKQAVRTLAFLGLGWDDAISSFGERASRKLVRSPTYAEVARPITRGAVGRWRHYRRHLEPYLDQLAPLVEAFGYERS